MCSQPLDEATGTRSRTHVSGSISVSLRISDRQLPWLAECETYHRLWNTLETEVKTHGLPERCVFGLLDSAINLKVRNATYRKAADLSPQVASRDLTALVNVGLLEMHGKARGAYYVASKNTFRLTEKCWEPKKVEDPFKLIAKFPKAQAELFGD